MQIKVRSFTTRDYEGAQALLCAVQKIHVQGRPDIYADVPDFSARVYYGATLHAPELLSAVAEEENGALVGVCLVSTEECSPGQTALLTPRRYASVEVLCVDEACRGQGIGERLLRDVRERAESMGLSSLELTVGAFNHSAQKFYEKLGYTVRSCKMELKLK